jgi:hypothetical protein
MKKFIEFIIFLIILIVLWHNFDKIVEMGDAIINMVYDKIVK